MRRWNLPQVNTKVMCAALTAAMVMTGFTACGGTTSAGTESAASESAEQKETIAPESTTEQSALEKSEEKVESYLGQITAIDGNVISMRWQRSRRLRMEKHRMVKSLTDRHQTATEALLMEKHLLVKSPAEKPRTVRNLRKIC